MATSASAAAAALAGLAVAKTAPSGRWGSSASFRRHRSSAGVRCNAGPARLKISANLGQLWEAAKGAPPAAVLAAAAAVAVVYKVASGFLAPPPPPPPRREQPVTEAPPPPPPPPVMVGELTEEELRQYDGSDPEKPLLMAIKGNIYDVSQSRMFYGPSGPYALFAGKDASRALAKMSFEPQDLTGDISGLGPFELSALQDWEYKFMGKYTQVGTIKKTAPVGDGTVCSSSEIEDKAVGGNPNEKKAPEILGVLSSMDTKEKEGNAEEGVGETKN